MEKVLETIALALMCMVPLVGMYVLYLVATHKERMKKRALSVTLKG